MYKWFVLWTYLYVRERVLGMLCGCECIRERVHRRSTRRECVLERVHSKPCLWMCSLNVFVGRKSCECVALHFWLLFLSKLQAGFAFWVPNVDSQVNVTHDVIFCYIKTLCRTFQFSSFPKTNRDLHQQHRCDTFINTTICTNVFNVVSRDGN